LYVPGKGRLGCTHTTLRRFDPSSWSASTAWSIAAQRQSTLADALGPGSCIRFGMEAPAGFRLLQVHSKPSILRRVHSSPSLISTTLRSPSTLTAGLNGTTIGRLNNMSGTYTFGQIRHSVLIPLQSTAQLINRILGDRFSECSNSRLIEYSSTSFRFHRRSGRRGARVTRVDRY
jgi:hypothetical protein